MTKNTNQPKKTWLLNTSNKGKLREFKQLFAEYDIAITSTEIDLKEISSDPLTVVVHKASQMGEEILVEDTSLDIEGAEVGIHVRSLLDHLSTYVGRKATQRVLLAYLKEGLVYVYEGKVDGTIVFPKGENGFGFDPVFLPDGSELTLAQAKPFAVNARAKVVEAFVKNHPTVITPSITQWDGPWQ
jgi:XTP/dITP diphosphohydrolase